MGPMESKISIETALGISDLRAGFLKYTQQAYSTLPPIDHPKILDIGCGSGLPTIELARLSGGEVFGIDIDDAALSKAQKTIKQANLSDKISVSHCSLDDVEFPNESFDILWAEGVLHCFNPSNCFPKCHRLLKPERFLVAHESIAWFENVDGTGKFGDERLITASVRDPDIVLSDDVDGDGDLDIIAKAMLAQYQVSALTWYENMVPLKPGDANEDGQFDQLDITAVLEAGKYLTGEPASWSEGDWNGDGVFDQEDIVAALATGNYLQGPYAAIDAAWAENHGREEHIPA